MKPYYETPNRKLYNGNALDVLRLIDKELVQTCITSPPYWGLRDYGVEGQLGLEKTPEEYVAKMVEIFREVRRVLRDDGTLWLNLGTSYAGSWGDSGHRPERTGNAGHQREKSTEWLQRSGHPQDNKPVTVSPPGFKPKDLVPIPWMVAMVLQSDGWYLRSDIIWHKPNPMPESVTDRPTKAHEYIFLLTKSAKYFYDADAIKEPMEEYERARRLRERSNGLETVFNIASDGKTGQSPQGKTGSVRNVKRRHELAENGTRNKRTVWTVATHPFPEAHFATFPPKLIEPCILAGSKEHDIVLDPFCGSGTTPYMANKYDRGFIAIDIKAEYLDMTIKRIGKQGKLPL